VKWRWILEGGLKSEMASQQLGFRKFSGFSFDSLAPAHLIRRAASLSGQARMQGFRVSESLCGTWCDGGGEKAGR
jgi:hypothetical protein